MVMVDCPPWKAYSIFDPFDLGVADGRAVLVSQVELLETDKVLPYSLIDAIPYEKP